MDGRKHLLAYVELNDGIPQAAARLGLPYSTMAAICNGTRGIGKNLAQRMQTASGGALQADRLIWVRPMRKEAA